VNRSRLPSWASGTHSWLKENGEATYKLAVAVGPNAMQSLGKFNSASEYGRRLFAAGVAFNGIEGAVVTGQELRKYLSGKEYSLARGVGGTTAVVGSVVRALGSPELGAPDLSLSTQNYMIGVGAALQVVGTATMYTHDPRHRRSEAARLTPPGSSAADSSAPVERPLSPAPGAAAGHASAYTPPGAHGAVARRRSV
jgi:hypothetical protein